MNIPGKSWTLLLAIMVMCSACSPENNNKKTAMIVELNVFSGRPNPTWSLSAEQSRELVIAFQDLPPADKPSQENGLGYRGFHLLNPDRVGGLAPHISIYAGIVTMTNDHVQYYRDVHDIEHRLMLQASQHGHKTIIESVSKGMANP